LARVVRFELSPMFCSGKTGRDRRPGRREC
jgi:hypothetical protein